jgi:sporulation integral membrane protein YtvI
MERKRPWVQWVLLGLVILAAVLLLPLTLPVLLGLWVAAALDPMILRLQDRTGLGRGAASGLCTTAVLGIAIALIWMLGRMLLGEISILARQLPDLLSAASDCIAALGRRLSLWSRQLPGTLGDAVAAWSRDLLSSSGTLAQRLSERIFSLVSALLGALPDGLLFAMTWVLSCYFAAAELPRLRELLPLLMPKSLLDPLKSILHSARAALGGWLHAQVRLGLVTFLILTVGFLLLQIGSPLLLGLLIALLDALPLFGTGAVLLPWSLLSMLSGDMPRGIGLLTIYGIAALTRNVLEPKFLGAQLGLSPLLTLVAIYAGWKLAGFAGMLLLPIAAMVLSQLWQGTRTLSQPEKRP